MGLVESHGNHGSHMTLQWGQWKPFRYCTGWQQGSIATGSHRHTCSAREEPKSWWIGVESSSFSFKHRWLGLGLALSCACELNTSGKWIFLGICTRGTKTGTINKNPETRRSER